LKASIVMFWGLNVEVRSPLQLKNEKSGGVALALSSTLVPPAYQAE